MLKYKTAYKYAKDIEHPSLWEKACIEHNVSLTLVNSAGISVVKWGKANNAVPIPKQTIPYPTHRFFLPKPPTYDNTGKKIKEPMWYELAINAEWELWKLNLINYFLYYKII